jgi:NitT/TauT family transport system substrate-binding protein
MMKAKGLGRRVAALMLALALPLAARAETGEVRLMKQVGLASLTLVVMEHEKLFEKHLAAAGLPATKVTWTRLVGGAMVNDAILSGNLDYAVAGIAPLAVIWSKTKGTPAEVKAVCGLNSIPIFLNTRRADLKTIRDITDKDRIAVPAVKVSIQAIILQMAAAKEWGEAQFARLDTNTVALAGNDATAALTSGAGEINTVMATAPFAQMQLEKPGIHTVLTSYEVLGGPHNLNLIYTTAKFREANPKTYAAFLAAFKEATELVNGDKRKAAEIYLQLSPEPVGVEALTKIIEDPRVQSSLTPQGVTKVTDFIYKTGMIKVKPGSWKDLFFPEVHDLPGN